jgi:hypothetical protein
MGLHHIPHSGYHKRFPDRQMNLQETPDEET